MTWANRYPIPGEVLVGSHGVKYCRETGGPFLVLTIAVITDDNLPETVECIVPIGMN